jgi:hypothetical protein
VKIIKTASIIAALIGFFFLGAIKEEVRQEFGLEMAAWINRIRFALFLYLAWVVISWWRRPMPVYVCAQCRRTYRPGPSTCEQCGARLTRGMKA